MHTCWQHREECFDAIVERLDLGGSRGAYSVLGLPDGAPMKDVRSAFREKAKHVHPDKCSKPECAKKFRVRCARRAGELGYLCRCLFFCCFSLASFFLPSACYSRGHHS